MHDGATLSHVRWDCKFILDVGTADEAAEGKIEGAVNIPLDDLQRNLDKLSKDKEIIVHCGTGMRARVAYSSLENGRYNTRFLNDKVAFINLSATEKTCEPAIADRGLLIFNLTLK